MVTLNYSSNLHANPTGQKCFNISQDMTFPFPSAQLFVKPQLSNESPDLHITSQRNIDVRSSQLCDKIDGFCVTSLSNFVPQTNRFPVSDLERRYYVVLCRLGQSERYQRVIAIIYRKVRCSFLSLGQSLKPGGRVNNFLISIFCRKLFDDCQPSVSRKHFFFSYIGENILKYNNKDQFKLIGNAFKGASQAQEIDTCRLLYFPICHCEHWFLFVVDLQDGLFAFMDSLYNENSCYQIVVRDLLVHNFKHLWRKLVNPEYSFDNFRIVYPSMPRQGNGNDCGVFVMKCMELWTPTVVLDNYFSKIDIPNIRVQYANQLFFSPNNTNDKSLATSLYEEVRLARVRRVRCFKRVTYGKENEE